MLAVLMLSVTGAKEATATPTPRSAAPPTATPTPTGPRGTLTVAIAIFQTENLDPGAAVWTDLPYSGHGYDFLVGTNPDGTLGSARGLAMSWRRSPNAKTWTFNLRKNVKWHDSKPFTADDVVFTFNERYKAKDAICTLCNILKANLVDVQAVDQVTAKFSLKNPDIVFDAVLSSREAGMVVLPRHNYRAKPDGGYERIGDPIGTGPWIFEKYTKGESASYRANTNYWDTTRIPDFARLVVLRRPEASTRLAMVKTGEADMALIETPQAREAAAAGLKILGPQGSSITVLTPLGANKNDMFCHNTEFRKALFLAIDMKAIRERIFPPGTAVTTASSIWTPPALGYDPDLKPYPFDQEEARRILQRIGYDGRPIKLWVVPMVTSPETPDLMDLIAGYWSQIGVKTELTPMEAGVFFPGFVFKDPEQPFDTKNYSCHFVINVPFANPSVIGNIQNSFLSRKNGGRLAFYWDYDFIDQEFLRLRQILDLKVLDVELRKLNRRVYSEYAFYPIVARNFSFAVGPKVAGWSPGNFGGAAALYFDSVKRAK
jgi:ABC-type transport system substrate-binding protein